MFTKMLIICMDLHYQDLFQSLNFKLIDVEWFYLNKFSDNSRKGCILYVDLDYLEELLNLHNDYPLAPKKTLIEKDMLSNYCKKIVDMHSN